MLGEYVSEEAWEEAKQSKNMLSSFSYIDTIIPTAIYYKINDLHLLEKGFLYTILSQTKCLVNITSHTCIYMYYTLMFSTLCLQEDIDKSPSEIRGNY